MSFSVIKNRVLLYPQFDPEQTKGGIWVPEVARNKADQGIVVAIGPDVIDIKVGDFVIFNQYSGQLIHVRSLSDKVERLIVLEEDFILARTSMSAQKETTVDGLFMFDGTSYFPATVDGALQFIVDATSKIRESRLKTYGDKKEFGKGI